MVKVVVTIEMSAVWMVRSVGREDMDEEGGGGKKKQFRCGEILSIVKMKKIQFLTYCPLRLVEWDRR